MIDMAFQFVLINVAIQIFFGYCVIATCRAQPGSFGYLFWGIIFLTHGGVATYFLGSFNVFVQPLLELGKISKADVDTVGRVVKFWEFYIPAISLGIGCSMIANFLAVKKS